MFGFGFPGQSFYSFDLPDKTPIDKFNGLVVVQEGEASEEKIAKELQHLVQEGWDFQVKQITEKKYRVAFPNKSSLDTFSRMTGIELALFGLKVKVIKTSVDPSTSSILQAVWLKIYGIPDFAKEEDIVKEIASLVGEPIKVDEFSLLRDEPARVRIDCRDPTKIRGYIEIFFNGVGYDIRFVAEGLQGRNKSKGDGPDGLGERSDKHNKEEDRDKKGRREKKSRRDPENSENEDGSDQEQSQADSLEDSMEEVIRDDSPEYSPEIDEIVVPLAAFHPTIGTIDISVGMNDGQEGQVHQTGVGAGEKGGKEIGLDATVHADKNQQIVAHGQEGVYLMSVDKWPKLNLLEPLAEDAQLTQEEDVMGEALMDEMPLPSEEVGIQGWATQAARAGKIRGRTPGSRGQPLLPGQVRGSQGTGYPLLPRQWGEPKIKMIC